MVTVTATQNGAGIARFAAVAGGAPSEEGAVGAGAAVDVGAAAGAGAVILGKVAQTEKLHSYWHVFVVDVDAAGVDNSAVKACGD